MIPPVPIVRPILAICMLGCLVFQTGLGNRCYAIEEALQSPISIIKNPSNITSRVQLLHDVQKTITSENGEMIPIQIWLDKKPIETTIVSISSDRPDEGLPNQTELRFSPNDWQQKKKIFVKGQDDRVADGNQTYHIILGVITGDYRYMSLPPVSFELMNTDNDTLAISTSTSGKGTDETGKSVTLFVGLTSGPVSPIELTVKSSNPAEAIVSPGKVIFNSSNWEIKQKVTVKGVDDYVKDGTRPFEVSIFSDSKNNRHLATQLTPVSIAFVNEEGPESVRNMGLSNSIKQKDKSTIHLPKGPTSHDVSLKPIKNIKKPTSKPGLRVNKRGVDTSEDREKVFFNLSLMSEPFQDVFIIARSSRLDEGIVVPESIVFTPENWNQTHEVVVIGQDDPVPDGDQAFFVEFSFTKQSDYLYSMLKPQSIRVLNRDNDIAGFEIITQNEFSSEQGDPAVIKVRLQSQPRFPVHIKFKSRVPGEGQVKDPDLIFTPDNWSDFQKIIVIGQEDFVADGEKRYAIEAQNVSSVDDAYDNLEVPVITLINREVSTSVKNAVIPAVQDLKSPTGSQLTPLMSQQTTVKEIEKRVASAGFEVALEKDTTSEDGETGQFSIRLRSQPIDTVTVLAKSLNPREGELISGPISFTTDNWQVAQIFRISGVDDDMDDGDQTYQIEISSQSIGDLDYKGITPTRFQMTNRDDDTAKLIINMVDPVSDENGKTALIKVRLATQPTHDVAFSLRVDDVDEGKLERSRLTFSPENWSIDQLIHVIGVDDDKVDGVASYNVIVTPMKGEDQKYSNTGMRQISLVNHDNDIAGIRIEDSVQTVSEKGQAIKVHVALRSEPLSPVRVTLIPHIQNQIDIQPDHLIFDKKNWRQLQAVHILGIDDDFDDGDQEIEVRFLSQSPEERIYSTLAPETRTYICRDDDQAGFIINKNSLKTKEVGTDDSFTIHLKSRPTAIVSLPLMVSDPNEGKLDKQVVVFSPENWSQPQTVLIKGEDDSIDDGHVEYQIITEPSVSEDNNYQNLNPINLTVVNEDDDNAGFVVSGVSGQTSEEGDTASFSVQLTSEPTHEVILSLSSDDETEGIPDKPHLVFHSDNWNLPQYVTVSGVNDEEVDGDQRYFVRILPAESEDTGYHKKDATDIVLTNKDNNVSTFVTTKARGNTNENGLEAHFFVRLTYQPMFPVSIHITSSDPQEGRPKPNRIEFTPENWEHEQRVTIQGIDDDVDDGDQLYEIIVKAVSDKEDIFSRTPSVHIHLSNIDNDIAGIKVKTIDNMCSESGDTASFSVKLTSRPNGTVVFIFNSENEAEGVLLNGHVAFSEKNWNKEQVVFIKGIPDHVVDKNQYFKISSEGAVSGDLKYGTLSFDPITLVNKNTDTADIIISDSFGITSEIGDTADFQFKLTSEPKAPVNLEFMSSDLDEGYLDKTRLVFNQSTWNSSQTVTVTGVDDHIKDEDKLYLIRFKPSQSEDSDYHGLLPPPIQLKNIDNKRITASLRLYYLLPTSEMKQNFEPMASLGLDISYVLNAYISISGTLYNHSLYGKTSKLLYGKFHDVTQWLDLLTLNTNIAIRVMKSPFMLHLKSGCSVYSWNFLSVTLTDGTQYTTSGSDVGLNLGLGIDFPVYKNVTTSVGLDYNVTTGGLGDRRFWTISSTLNYPF